MSAEQADIRQMIGELVTLDSQEGAEQAAAGVASTVATYLSTLGQAGVPLELAAQLAVNFQNNLFLGLQSAIAKE